MKHSNMKHKIDLLREARSGILEVFKTPEKGAENPPQKAAPEAEKSKPAKSNKKITRP